MTPHANKGKADICLVHESEAGGCDRLFVWISTCHMLMALNKNEFIKRGGIVLYN